MAEVLVWCVRLGLALVLVGTASLVAALALLVCDIGTELRHILGAVAIGAFSSLVLLVSAWIIFWVSRRVWQQIQNRMSRRSLR